jgi:uncharacterized protein YjbJ (UPF0337 family)
MKKQEARGKVKKTTGKVKEAVGILSGNKKLEREGSRQRTKGAVQEGIGKARNAVSDALKSLGNAISK